MDNSIYEDMPLVSVIIPVYNGKSYLAEAIDSVLCQTYNNIEVIAVDDGSVDGSEYVLRSYGDKISWFSQKNSGVATARNAALLAARGKYVALLDQDDLWLPNKIFLQIEAFKRNPGAVLVWGGAVKSKTGCISEQNGKLCHEELENFDLVGLFRHNLIPTLTAMFDRNVALSIGCFDEKTQPCDDWDMWIRLSQVGSLSYVAQTLAIYRVHEKQVSNNKYTMTMAELYVIKKNKEIYLTLSDGKINYSRDIANRLKIAAYECVKIKKYHQAVRLALSALSYLELSVWAACIKIIIESIFGQKYYSKLVSIIKR